MQKELSGLLAQKNRLAQLGLAVSKINHDLRNMLANAQLISDRLVDLPDPTVQRFVPKLIASLDRAISFCNSSLQFGGATEAAPRRELLLLKPLVEEVADSQGLPREGEIALVADMDDGLRIDADRDHLFRVLSNLVRNAMQAIEGRRDRRQGRNHRQRPSRRPQGHRRLCRQRPRRAGEGARKPVQGVPGLDQEGRHRPRPRDRAGTGAGPRRHAEPGAQPKGRVVPNGNAGPLRQRLNVRATAARRGTGGCCAGTRACRVTPAQHPDFQAVLLCAARRGAPRQSCRERGLRLPALAFREERS